MRWLVRSCLSSSSCSSSCPRQGRWTWPVQGPVLQTFSFDQAHPYAAGQHRGIAIGAGAGARGACARVGRRQLRRLGADERADAHDPDSVRPRGQPHAPRLDRGRGARERRRRRRGRHGRPERHARVRRAVRAPRHPRRLERPGLPRSARVPARARAAGPVSAAPAPAPVPAPAPAPVPAPAPAPPVVALRRPTGCAAGRAAGRPAGRDRSSSRRRSRRLRHRFRLRRPRPLSPASRGACGRRGARRSGADRPGAQRRRPRRRRGAARAVDRAVAPVRSRSPRQRASRRRSSAPQERRRRHEQPAREASRVVARLGAASAAIWSPAGLAGAFGAVRSASGVSPALAPGPHGRAIGTAAHGLPAGGPRAVGARGRRGAPRGRSYDL